MNKIAKIIRVLTISPIMALMTCLVIYFGVDDSFSSVLIFLITIFCLVVFPVLAYPFEQKFNIVKRVNNTLTPRAADRKMAIIFSVISYSLILIVVFLNHESTIVKQLILTYFISGVLIAISSFALKFEASGHMCGMVGPMVFLTVTVSYWFLLILIPLAFVVWSSLKLKRHTVLQLIFGSLMPVVGFIISLIVIS